jgi:hypothetical protein
MTLTANESFTQQPLRGRGMHTNQRVNYRDGNHEAHVQALQAWLHPDLRDLPDIDWASMPGRVIGYLVNTLSDSPHAPHVTFALGTALGAVSACYLHDLASRLHLFLRPIPKQCETWNGRDFTKEVLDEYLSKMTMTFWQRNCILGYSAVTERYVAEYVERASLETKARIAPYLLPRLPARFLERNGGPEVVATSQRRRKEQSDVLAPLHSILVALIQFRKQEAFRLLQAFREACRRADTGEALPISFSYEDTIAEVNRDARTVAEIRMEKRPITLTFLLWNRRSWVMQHLDHYTDEPRRQAAREHKSYSPETDGYIVQCLNPPSDLLWFGDLVDHRLLQQVSGLRKRTAPDEEDEKILRRLRHAEAAGAPNGFKLERPGLLTPAGGWGRWLAKATQCSGALLFEPESLYRGVLYASALTTLALTNGSRLSELLQVSADRFKGYPYEEKKQGQPTGKQRVLWLQYLLPKGKKTEEERQLFPISTQSYELLREMGTLLKEAHGNIPAVRPHPENTKAEDLCPERYLFQWAATPDGHDGALAPHDVRLLIRFILHGLEFRTKQGEPFMVSTHLLRHVMATAARQEHEVPAEAVAYVLHHKQVGLAIPEATQYYSQQTQEQQLQALAEFLETVEDQATSIVLSMPDERTLSQMDDDLRDVFERWHTLLETAFGFCGRAGLCPRGHNRSLCLGCPHLVPNPDKRPEAIKWRAAYAKQAEDLERDGALIDARQVLLQVQELDDLINSMHVIRQAMDDGKYAPLFLQLPAAPYDEVTDG